jgi:hypothetical protein
MQEPTFCELVTKLVTRENVNRIPANVKGCSGLFQAYQQCGSSFLALVLHVGSIDALEWLLSTFKGHIDFSIPNIIGVTPLQFAVVNWPQMVSRLIEAGAPISDDDFMELVRVYSFSTHYNHLHQDAAEAFFKVPGAVDLDRHYKGMPDWLVRMFIRYRGYRQSCHDAVVTVLGIQRFRKPLVAERFLAREIARMIWATRCDNKWE